MEASEAAMKKTKLCAVILPWVLLQNFSFNYEYTAPVTGTDASMHIRVNSHSEQPVKPGTRR